MYQTEHNTTQQHSTAQHSTAQHSTAQHSTAQLQLQLQPAAATPSKLRSNTPTKRKISHLGVLSDTNIILFDFQAIDSDVAKPVPGFALSIRISHSENNNIMQL